MSAARRVVDCLFVYGTLRGGAPQALATWRGVAATWVGRGTVCGRLYDLGRYPGLRPSSHPRERVHGEVYRLDRGRLLLARLDRYEGCAGSDALYRRVLRPVRLEDGTRLRAWVYVCRHAPPAGTRIASGDHALGGEPVPARARRTGSRVKL